MFDSISGSYDLLNKILSLGIDQSWRKKALSTLKSLQPRKLLDVATGTGDLAFMANNLLHPEHITGIDLSGGMLEVAKRRYQHQNPSSLPQIDFIK